MLPWGIQHLSNADNVTLLTLIKLLNSTYFNKYARCDQVNSTM